MLGRCINSFPRWVCVLHSFGRRLSARQISFKAYTWVASGRKLYRASFFGFSTSAVVFAATVKGFENKGPATMADVEKAEALYKEHKFKEVYEFLLAFKNDSNPELLWRFVRASRDRAIMPDVSKEEKQKLIFDAFEVAKRALALGEDNFACHKWYGIMLSETGNFLGTKKKIEDSPAMKKHFERAVELNPKDSTSHHLIGMWCFSFADLAWYERKIAALVFGKPPESTYDEALTHFLHSEELAPGSYSTNQLMIATVYLRLGKKQEAKQWFTKVTQFECHKEDDYENVKKAQEHLKSL